MWEFIGGIAAALVAVWAGLLVPQRGKHLDHVIQWATAYHKALIDFQEASARARVALQDSAANREALFGDALTQLWTLRAHRDWAALWADEETNLRLRDLDEGIKSMLGSLLTAYSAGTPNETQLRFLEQVEIQCQHISLAINDFVRPKIGLRKLGPALKPDGPAVLLSKGKA